MKKQTSSHAQAAQQIRKILKESFPEIKFSVKSRCYSGGSSIGVGYENGPKRHDVEKLISQYKYGTFDGMTDSYNYTNVVKDLPQVTYLQVTRYITDEFWKKLFDIAKDIFHDFRNVDSVDEWHEDLMGTGKQYLYRYVTDMDFKDVLPTYEQFKAVI